MDTAKSPYHTQANWQFYEQPLATDAAAALNTDSLWLQQVGRGERGPLARLWENPQSLIVTRRETRLPDYQYACRTLQADGWPVIVRESGGTAVPHGPGTLNFSLLYALDPQQSYDLDAVYQALCEPIRRALAQLDLEALYGCVDGAYCDGRYNLVVDGLKVTGTAQRKVICRDNQDAVKHAVLAQAMLMVDCDAAAGTRVVNRFYQLAGDPRVYDTRVSSSIAERLRARSANSEQLTSRVRALIRQSFQSLAETGPGQG